MRTPLISLLHATRGRADVALNAKETWLRAASNVDSIEHIFAFDCDDMDSHARLGVSTHTHVVVPEASRGCVAAWNLAAAASKGDVLVQMSDDWVPVEHWDRKIADRFRDVSKSGVLKISDGQRVDDLLCMAIFTRAWLEALGGEFLSSEYFGVYSDDEFSFRSYKAGTVIDARDLVFKHLHPNYDDSLTADETHQRQNLPSRREEGRRTFLRRNPDAVNRWLHDWTDERRFIPVGHGAFCDPASAISVSPGEMARQLAEMQQSLSWRITKPLRWLKMASKR